MNILLQNISIHSDKPINTKNSKSRQTDLMLKKRANERKKHTSKSDDHDDLNRI